MPPIEGFGVRRHRRPAQGRRRDRRCAPSPSVRRPGGRVAGGGLLGLEAAYALHKLGMQDGRARALRPPAQAPARPARRRAAARYLEGLGLEIVIEAETQARRRQRAGCDACTLERRPPPGRRSICSSPRASSPTSSSPSDAGLAINRGVLVDDRMRTDDPHILAAGDVAEFGGQLPGLWPTAVAQAEVAADTAVGGDKAYDAVVPVTILKVVGIELTSIGRFEAAGSRRRGDRPRGRLRHEYRKLVIADGRIVGAILLGSPGRGRARPHRDHRGTRRQRRTSAALRRGAAGGCRPGE